MTEHLECRSWNLKAPGSSLSLTAIVAGFVLGSPECKYSTTLVK